MSHWGIVHALESVGAIMTMFFAAWLIGAALLNRWLRPIGVMDGASGTPVRSHLYPVSALIAIALGLGVLIALAMLMAWLHILAPKIMWAVLLASIAVSYRGWPAIRACMQALGMGLGHLSRMRGSERVLLILLVIEAVSVLSLDLTPVIGWDASVYHLTVPLRFLQSGGWINLPTIAHSYLDLNIEMLFLWALALHGEQAAHLIPGALGLLAGLSVYATARHVLPKGFSLFAMGMFLWVPLIWVESTDLFIDLGMTLFLLASLLALLLPRRAGQAMPLVIAALMFGLAMGCKLMAVLFAPVIGWCAFVRIRRYGSAGGSAYLLAMLACAVPTLVWHVRTFLLTGNPLYPIGNAFFGLPVPLALRGGDQVFTTLSLPWRILLAPWHQAAGYYSSATPWEGGWGPFCLAFAPLGLFTGMRSWCRVWIYPLLGSCLLYLIITPYPRYGVPLLALWSVYAAYGLWGCRARFPMLFRFSMIGTLVAGGVFCGLFLAKAVQRSPVIVGMQSVQAYLRRYDSIYPAAVWVNAHRKAGGAVLLIGERSLRFRRPVYVMMSFSPFFDDLLARGDGAALDKRLCRMGVTDIVVSGSYLRTNLSAVRPVLLEFLHRYGEKRYKAGDFSVYRLVAPGTGVPMRRDG